MTKPNILIVNDDGIFAPGLAALITAVQTIGTPYIMAPDKPQSGQGHAITIHDPIKVEEDYTFPGIKAHKCSGTPVDCVKLARHVIYKDIEFDLCVSGINHGSNAAINIIYSGTMSAAMEASLEGIPAIGFSLCDISMEADFKASTHYAAVIIRWALDHTFEKCLLLNVNIPKLAIDKIKGIKVCRQGKSGWKEDFMEVKNPRGESYYWMTGEFVLYEEAEDTDINALGNGYISVVPSMHDLTAHTALDEVRYLENI